MRRFVGFAFLFVSITLVALAEDGPGKAKTATTACSFQDGRQISVRYEPFAVTKKKADLPLNELWPPSGSPMYLFSQASVSLGNTEIPTGAYSLYVIPEKEQWTLIINKGVNAGVPYDQQQDLLRLPMQIGHLSEPGQHFKVVFGHIAPQQCNMRIYYGKTGAWAEFREK